MAQLSKRRIISLPLVLNGCVSSLVLLVGMTPTMGAFSASISSVANTAGAGTIVMQEMDETGTITCMSTEGAGVDLNTATCSGINKYGGAQGMRPGDTVAVAGSIRNVGTVAASTFALAPGACVQSASGPSSGSATDFCSRISVNITSGSATIFSGTASSLGSVGTIDLLARLGLVKLPAGATMAFTVTMKVDAGIDNSYQGLKVAQPMTWTFGA